MKSVFKFSLLILLSSALLGFSSCANSSGGGGGGGSVSVPASGSVMMRLPSVLDRAVYQMSDANYYDITLISEDSSSIQKKSGIPGATIEFKNLAPQTYTVHVYAYSSDTKETLVAESDDVDASVVAGKQSDVIVTMIPKTKIEPPAPSSPSGSGSGSGSGSDGATSSNPPVQNPFDGFTEVANWSALCQLVNNYSNKDDQLCVLLKSGGEMSQTLTVQGNVLIQTDTNVTLTRPTTFSDSLIKVVSNGSLVLGGANSKNLIIDGNKTSFSAYEVNSLINVNGGTLEITANCRLQNARSSQVAGPAVNITNGNFSLTGGAIINNQTSKNGGAIYANNSICTITSGTISGNTSTCNKSNTAGGGAIYITGASSVLTMTGGNIEGNKSSSSYGGGVFVNSGATFDFNGGTISENTAGSGLNGKQVYYASGATFNKNGTKQTSYLE